MMALDGLSHLRENVGISVTAEIPKILCRASRDLLPAGFNHINVK
jgi:hypothetical protein